MEVDEENKPNAEHYETRQRKRFEGERNLFLDAGRQSDSLSNGSSSKSIIPDIMPLVKKPVKTYYEIKPNIVDDVPDLIFMEDSPSERSYSPNSASSHLHEPTIFSPLASIENWAIPEYLRESTSSKNKRFHSVTKVASSSGASKSRYEISNNNSAEVRIQALHRKRAVIASELFNKSSQVINPHDDGEEEFDHRSIAMPEHCHSSGHGWMFKNMQCLLHPVRRETLPFNANARSHVSTFDAHLEHCEDRVVTEHDYKTYNLFEIELLEHPELNKIIEDVCYNRISPYKLADMFGITNIFQPYIRVATWAEFEEFFCGGILNTMVNNLVDNVYSPTT